MRWCKITLVSWKTDQIWKLFYWEWRWEGMETNEERGERKLYGWRQSLGSGYVHGTLTWRCTAAVERLWWESSLGRGEVRLQSRVKEAPERDAASEHCIPPSHFVWAGERAGSALHDPSVTSCRQPGLPQFIIFYSVCLPFVIFCCAAFCGVLCVICFLFTQSDS